MSTLKEKLVNREPVTGTHVFLKDPCVSELLASVGYDVVWIDTEHTAIDYGTLEQHVISCHSGGTECVVRLPWHEQIMAKRVMEMGPSGIIFPTVNTLEEMEDSIRYSLYPPEGVRGFGPMRAIRYGLDDANEYCKRIQNDMVRIIQIESYVAIENLEKMLNSKYNKYVDCYLFGPNDLSGSIGRLGDAYGEETSKWIDRGIELLKKAGKSIAVSSSPEDEAGIKYWHDKGINVLFMGLDYLHLMRGAVSQLEMIRHVQAGDRKL